MKRYYKLLAGCVTWAVWCATGAAGGNNDAVTSATSSFSPGIKGSLERIVAEHDGIMGIYVRNLETSETLRVNADDPFPTASTIKLAVMCAAFDKLADGTGPYDSYYDTTVYDASTSTGGSGFIRNYIDGTKLELKELIHLMITVSDNIATNMICDWISLEEVNNWLIDHDFQTTRMFATIGGRTIYDPEGRKKDWGLGVTTPEEMGRLMELIVTGRAGTTSTTDEMLRVLGHQYFDGGIAAGVPPITYVGSKGGSLNRSRSDVALVASPAGKYIVSVYTKENGDTSWENTNEAEAAIRKISRLVWQHFNPKSDWAPAAGTEKF